MESEFALTTAEALWNRRNWGTAEHTAVKWVERHIGYCRVVGNLPVYGFGGERYSEDLSAGTSIRIVRSGSFILIDDQVRLTVEIGIVGPDGGYAFALYSDLANPEIVLFER